MVRILLGGFLGAVVLFMWGFVVHMVIHLHSGVIHQLPDEQGFVDVMVQSEAPTGTYLIPYTSFAEHRAMSEEERSAVRSEWEANIRRGPIAIMMYRDEGWSRCSR